MKLTSNFDPPVEQRKREFLILIGKRKRFKEEDNCMFLLSVHCFTHWCYMVSNRNMPFCYFAFQGVGVCTHGATWKHLDVLSSKTGPQTELPLSYRQGGSEGTRQETLLLYKWRTIADGETITERLLLRCSSLGVGKK